MRNLTIDVAGKKVRVRELTVREIKTLADMPEDVSIADRLTGLLETCADGIKKDDLLDFAPSELQPLIDTMLEVNSAFFDQASAIGMDAAGEALKQMIGAVSMIAFCSASETVTEH